MFELNYPEVPAHHRGRRGAVVRMLARMFLKITGWRLQGTVPEYPRFITVTGPHTSNWDFVYGLCGALTMNLDIHWLGKDSLFTPPLGPLMRWLGGIPVDRVNTEGVAEGVAETIRRAETMALIITPEGTRSRVDRWKTGFLRIAEMSDSVLVITTVDFAEKTIVLGEVMRPSGDPEADIAHIQAAFARVTPRNRQNH